MAQREHPRAQRRQHHPQRARLFGHGAVAGHPVQALRGDLQGGDGGTGGGEGEAGEDSGCLCQGRSGEGGAAGKKIGGRGQEEKAVAEQAKVEKAKAEKAEAAKKQQAEGTATKAAEKKAAAERNKAKAEQLAPQKAAERTAAGGVQ
eukprot:3140144-Pleurochrysis_carterae.AAC.1